MHHGLRGDGRPCEDLSHSFIPSFNQAISIAPLPVLYYSKALPTTARILCRSFTPKRYRQLRVKDLPKVHTCTWRLEWDSNKAPTLPLNHHAPRFPLHPQPSNSSRKQRLPKLPHKRPITNASNMFIALTSCLANNLFSTWSSYISNRQVIIVANHSA